MISSLLLIFHVVVCAALILVVLLQAGKGGGLAGAFGGGGGQTGQALFGGRGAATVLTKATTVLGIIFLVTSLILALLAARASGPTSVIRDQPAPGTVTPALDAPSPAEVGLGGTQEAAGETVPVDVIPVDSEEGAAADEGQDSEGGSDTP